MGDADSIKGGSLVYMPYTHSTLVRGNGHRILISDIQLLQWYSKRRDIRRNPLPYQHTKDSIMNLLADRETTATRDDSSQILVTPATDENDIVTTPLQPALVQHASTDNETAQPTSTTAITPKPRQARIPIPTPSSLRRNPTTRAKTTFYKPHDIRNVTAAVRKIMDIDSPPHQSSQQTTTNCKQTRTSCGTMQ